MRSARFLRSRVVLTVAVAVVVAVALATPALAFPDVPAGHPYEAAVNGLSSAGIISGYASGDFGLNDPVKRAQFAKMVVGALHIAPGAITATRFTDLGTPDAGGYPHEYVQAAYDKGITYGTNSEQTLFDPWASIRRDQVVSMIVRGAKSVYPGVLTDPPAGTSSLFSGVPEPHGQNLRIAEHNGLLAGLIGLGSSWDVTAKASRGEVAQMLWNLLQKVSGGSPVADITVNVDGSGDYPTLEAALAHAGSDATIHLGAGVFNLADTIHLGTSVKLVGAGTDPGSGTTLTHAGDVLDVERADLTATGVRFVSTATGDSEVMFAYDSDVILQSCYFSGGGKAGAGDGYGDGLRVSGNSTASVTNCVFTANAEHGLVIEGGTKAVVQGNSCTNNHEHGMLLWGDSADTATGNTCTGNTLDGLVVAGEAHAKLQQNVCSSNGAGGIVIEGAAVCSVLSNICSSNFYDGITCFDQANVTLEHNTCQHNGWDGISLLHESTGTVRSNDCSYSETKNGIEVSDSAQATVEDNTCLHDHQSGVWFGDTAGGSATGNECAFCTYGILVDATAHPTIGTNNLHDNTNDLVMAGS